jgi:hypothetical protein
MARAKSSARRRRQALDSASLRGSRRGQRRRAARRRRLPPAELAVGGAPTLAGGRPRAHAPPRPVPWNVERAMGRSAAVGGAPCASPAAGGERGCPRTHAARRPGRAEEGECWPRRRWPQTRRSSRAPELRTRSSTLSSPCARQVYSTQGPHRRGQNEARRCEFASAVPRDQPSATRSRCSRT